MWLFEIAMERIMSRNVTRHFLLIIVSIIDCSIFAQQKEQSNLLINTDLVTTWAEVSLRPDRIPVKGLNIEDFYLQEDGQKHNIALLKEDPPLSVIILVDGMTCVTEPWYRNQSQLFHQLGQETEISLMAWDSDAALVFPFTKNKDWAAMNFSSRYNFFLALNPGLYGNDPLFGNRILVRPERTHHRPGEAIYQATKYLERSASPDRRKVIIVISPANIEIASKHLRTVTEVEALLEKTGTTVYGLVHGEESSNVSGLLKTLTNPKRELKGTFSGRLNDFVDFTGGTTIVGKWEKCDAMFIKLAKMIRSSYTIGYYPDNSNFDGRFRRIKVELSPSGKAKAGKADIRTRDGYHAIRHTTTPAVVTKTKQ
jgi:VWFA-related protein